MSWSKDIFGTHGGKTATSKMVRHAINPLAIYAIQPLAHFGFQNGIPGDHLNVECDRDNLRLANVHPEPTRLGSRLLRHHDRCLNCCLYVFNRNRYVDILVSITVCWKKPLLTHVMLSCCKTKEFSNFDLPSTIWSPLAVPFFFLA